MNRADMTRNLLLLEQVAKKAYARAARLREQLQAKAVDEYQTEGTAPSWGIPDLGRLVLPITKDVVVVTDEQKLVGWLEENLPHAVEKRPRSADLKALLDTVLWEPGQSGETDFFCLPNGRGGLIPGLAMRRGGTPKTLTFTPDGTAAKVAGQAADALLGKVVAELGIELPADEETGAAE